MVISAAFWGSVWGPVGLLLSTPLTVCLVVAGRHLPALEALAVLLGAAPDVTAAQRFFQRTLTGETAAIVRDAARFLRRATLARYCDQVLLPGLALAATELELGRIDAGQQHSLRRAIADVAEAVAPGPGQGGGRKRHAASLLDANVGAHLRRLREARLGRWQGSFDVPRRSIVLCAGLPTERDELVSELLARALREAGIDARSIPLPLPYEEHDPATAELVCTVLLPCPQPDTLDTWQEAVAAVRQLLPDALLAAIRLPGDDTRLGRAAFVPLVDAVLRSFEEGLAFAGPAADGRQAGRAGGGAR